MFRGEVWPIAEALKVGPRPLIDDLRGLVCILGGLEYGSVSVVLLRVESSSMCGLGPRGFYNAVTCVELSKLSAGASGMMGGRLARMGLVGLAAVGAIAAKRAA